MTNTTNTELVQLIIDTREHDLISKIKCNYQIEQLPIGDIVYRDTTNGESLLTIERKTISDLKASICDGRYREQKLRLLGTSECTRILYIIEGSIIDNNRLPSSTVIGSIINTLLRDNIKVHRTYDLIETATFISKLLEKLNKEKDSYFNCVQEGITTGQYCQTLKKGKKANMTPEAWFICQLSMIPQVTEVIAVEIQAKHKTLIELVRLYEKIPDDMRPKLLSDIMYPIKNDKQRRIGDKISERVYEFLYGIEKKHNDK